MKIDMLYFFSLISMKIDMLYFELTTSKHLILAITKAVSGWFSGIVQPKKKIHHFVTLKLLSFFLLLNTKYILKNIS